MTETFPGVVVAALYRFARFPEFVKKQLDPGKHKKVGMFC